MNAKFSTFLSCAGAVLFLLGGGTFGAPEAVADDHYRRDFRRHDGRALRAAAVHHEVRTHERERRAFVAGAVAQQHRDDYRGEGYGYRDGYPATVIASATTTTMTTARTATTRSGPHWSALRSVRLLPGW